MQLPRVAIVAVLGGCELLANVPSYTATPGDGGGVDAGDAGDAGPMECQTSTECTAPEVCVMNQCQPCDRDAHCGDAMEHVCLPDGTCADTARIVYASPGGAGLACTLPAPCAITQAFMNAAGSPTLDIVKLLPGTYPRDAQITVGADTVILAAEGATLMATAIVAMFRVTSGSLTIVGGELVGMQQFNALCFGPTGQLGTLRLHRTTSRGGAYGVGGFNCNLELTRSLVMQNSAIGVYASTGNVRITSSVIMANGTPGTPAQGGVQLLQVMDARIEQSTIIGNVSEDDTYAGGITCRQNATNLVTTSISWGNVGTALGPLDAACNVAYSVVEPAFVGGTNVVRQDPLFQAVGDFHLQATSPARGAGDPAFTIGADFDNEPRPQGDAAFDCGADEIQ